MLDFLTEQWQKLTKKDVYERWWPFGIFTGVNRHSGVFNSNPLSNFLNGIFEEFGYTIKRKFVVSCVDVNSGAYVLFNETTEDPAKAIVSSASIPFVFPSQRFEDSNVVCMDGGTVWNTNLVSAVERCREQVDEDSQITLDIIICDQKSMKEWGDKRSALANYLRFKDIRDYNDGVQDIYEFKQAYPEVNFRHFLMPSEPLKGGLNLLNFDNSTNTYSMQMLGRLDGQNAQKAGEGFYFQKMDEWRDTPGLQATFPKLSDYLNSLL
mmetsp:Transcript_17536/g.29580  ORF Transcript_17536/g.29580 Transcript_17536/m.29580 type:complete len:266 (+) Transcript_17536:329-1126(+)